MEAGLQGDKQGKAASIRDLACVTFANGVPSNSTFDKYIYVNIYDQIAAAEMKKHNPTGNIALNSLGKEINTWRWNAVYVMYVQTCLFSFSGHFSRNPK